MSQQVDQNSEYVDILLRNQAVSAEQVGEAKTMAVSVSVSPAAQGTIRMNPCAQ